MSTLLTSNIIKIPELERKANFTQWLEIVEASLNVINVTDQDKFKYSTWLLRLITHLKKVL